jgi:hypothetical protein
MFWLSFLPFRSDPFLSFSLIVWAIRSELVRQTFWVFKFRKEGLTKFQEMIIFLWAFLKHGKHGFQFEILQELLFDLRENRLSFLSIFQCCNCDICQIVFFLYLWWDIWDKLSYHLRRKFLLLEGREWFVQSISLFLLCISYFSFAKFYRLRGRHLKPWIEISEIRLSLSRWNKWKHNLGAYIQKEKNCFYIAQKKTIVHTILKFL